MKVRYDEGVAIHIHLESCEGSREAVREVLTGEHAGQPSSRERLDIRRLAQDSSLHQPVPFPSEIKLVFIERIAIDILISV